MIETIFILITMPAKTTRQTLARQWELLKQLPKSGSGKPASALMETLNKLGFIVTKRQVERDLAELRNYFPNGDLECNDKSKPYGWKWRQNASISIPGMTLPEALSLCMVKDMVQGMLPTAMWQVMEQPFLDAQKKIDSLADDTVVARWSKLVCNVIPTLPMIPPTIADGVLTIVQECLLGSEQIKVDYQKMGASVPEPKTLHPLGLVNRGQIIYLIATTDVVFPDARIYAVHRISRAERPYQPARRPEGFDLDTYIKSGAMQFGDGQELHLTARVEDYLERILSETPLSKDQMLKDGMLSATVQDTQQLKYWLLSQGEGIRVTGPAELRDWMKKSLQGALARY